MTSMYRDDKKKKGTSVMSFRLDEDIVDALRKEAEEEEVSLNVLAGHVFRRYVEWERDARKVGFIPVTRDLLISLITEVDDKKIEEIVRKVGKNIFKAQILYMENRYDLDSFLKWMEVTNRMSGFAQKHVVEAKTHEYIIQHDLNMKWSLYMRTLYEMILEDVYRKKIDFEVTPSTIVFKIER
jgi:hypothetical protein